MKLEKSSRHFNAQQSNDDDDCARDENDDFYSFFFLLFSIPFNFWLVVCLGKYYSAWVSTKSAGDDGHDDGNDAEHLLL